MNKQVAIFGYYGFENTGDDAVLQSILDDFRTLRDDLDFVVFSNNPHSTSQQYGVKSVVWNDFYLTNKVISESDLVIIGGGGLFNEYIEYPPGYFLKPNHSYFSVSTFGIPVIAKLYNKPCMIFGAGASSITSEAAKQDISLAITACDIVTVRDEGTRGIFKNILKPQGCEIVVTADPVFRLATNNSRFKDEAIIKKVKELPKPIIGMSLRNWDWKEINTEALLNKITNAIKDFYQENGGALLLLPFDNGGVVGSLSEDEEIFNKLLEKLNGEIPYVKVEGYLNPQLALELIANCQICLCMRLHAIIMSLRNGTPVIGLAYDEKVKNVLAHCGLEELIFEEEDFTDRDLYAQLNDLFLKTDIIKSQITKASEREENVAFSNIKKALSLLDSRESEQISPNNQNGEAIYDMLFNSFINEIERHLDTKCEFLFEAEDFKGVVELLQALKPENLCAPQCYKLAFSLQNQCQREEALKYYNLAEEKGFDKFWVRYNRGQLYKLLGREGDCIQELKLAYELNPAHVGLIGLIKKYVK